jgi:phosphinothricin acetyltransferase
MTIIRPAVAAYAADMARIYNHYVDHTVVTFETEPVAADEMSGRLMAIRADGLPWSVAECDGAVAGYAYASKWKGRCAYRYSAETTVYLDPSRLGQGLGRALYAAILADLRAQSLHVAIGGVALPNDRSVRLHEGLGFRKVAHFEQVGFKLGQWIDVGYWQVLL